MLSKPPVAYPFDPIAAKFPTAHEERTAGCRRLLHFPSSSSSGNQGRSIDCVYQQWMSVGVPYPMVLLPSKSLSICYVDCYVSAPPYGWGTIYLPNLRKVRSASPLEARPNAPKFAYIHPSRHACKHPSGKVAHHSSTNGSTCFIIFPDFIAATRKVLLDTGGFLVELVCVPYGSVRNVTEAQQMSLSFCVCVFV